MVNHAMRGVVAFSAGLAHEVAKVHRSRCPCCARPMHNRKPKLDMPTPTDLRTVAHNVPTSFGGNPAVWVYACHRCNNEQGRKTFRQWAANLSAYRDPRFPLVAALADVIDQWLSETGVDPWGGRERDNEGEAA